MTWQSWWSQKWNVMWHDIIHHDFIHQSWLHMSWCHMTWRHCWEARQIIWCSSAKIEKSERNLQEKCLCSIRFVNLVFLMNILLTDVKRDKPCGDSNACAQRLPELKNIKADHSLSHQHHHGIDKGSQHWQYYGCCRIVINVIFRNSEQYTQEYSHYQPEVYYYAEAKLCFYPSPIQLGTRDLSGFTSCQYGLSLPRLTPRFTTVICHNIICHDVMNYDVICCDPSCK